MILRRLSNNNVDGNTNNDFVNYVLTTVEKFELKLSDNFMVTKMSHR